MNKIRVEEFEEIATSLKKLQSQNSNLLFSLQNKHLYIQADKLVKYQSELEQISFSLGNLMRKQHPKEDSLKVFF